MGNPAGSFVWYELLTSDLDAAADFYRDVVGIEIQRAPTPGPLDYRMVSAPDGDNVGGAMRLTDGMREHGMRPIWLGYVAVEDVDAACERLTLAGGKVHMAPQVIEGAGRIAMVADPQGAAFYLMRPSPPPGKSDAVSTAFHPEAHGHVAWNELHTREQAEAMRFYEEQLGWERMEALDMGPMGTYQMFKAGGTDQAIGGMMTSPNMARPMWLHYFNVPEIDVAHDRIAERGGSVLAGPSEIPGGQYMVQGTDPQGAMFAIVGPRKRS